MIFKGEGSGSPDFPEPHSNLAVDAQLISGTKLQSLQVFVATWNVGGKSPDSLDNGLNLDDFLQVNNETDIYLLGSFNDEPVNGATTGPRGKELFEKEEGELLADLLAIPKKACDRWINEFVKRARAATIHAFVISHLKKMMSAVVGRAKGQHRLIDNLEDEFAKVQRELHLPAGDFLDVVRFKEVLEGFDVDKFERLKPKLIQEVDHMLDHEIPELMKKFKNPYE